MRHSVKSHPDVKFSLNEFAESTILKHKKLL